MNDNTTDSQPEKDILRCCIMLMHELTDEFEEWYKWVHGEDAVAELSEEERFCLRMTYFHIVQKLFLLNTLHGGGTSTIQKCDELGIADWSQDVEFKFESEDEDND